MRRVAIFVAAAGGLVAAGTVVAFRSQTERPVLRRTLTSSKAYSRSMLVYNDIERSIESGDYATAERTVDGNIKGPVGRMSRYHNVGALHGYKAALLARRGDDAAALTEYMGLLRGRYGAWSANSRDLTPALEIAVRHGRAKDADEIATRIDANHEVSFSPFPCLDVPDPITTPARRLAYAYLVLADHAQGNMDEASRLRYVEQATTLAPNDVPVLFQTATAYCDRKAKGDRTRAETLLRRAYALLPEGSSDRRDLRNDAWGRVRIDSAGPQERATLNADVFASVTENRLRNEALNDAKARQAAHFREARGMPPLGVAPPRP